MRWITTLSNWLYQNSLNMKINKKEEKQLKLSEVEKWKTN